MQVKDTRHVMFQFIRQHMVLACRQKKCETAH
jgi:hypothetical protein